MTQPKPHNSVDSATAANAVMTPAQILVAFEKRLQTSGTRQHAEQSPGLTQVAPDDLRPLLFGMLQHEMDYRQQQDAPITLDELRARFPNDDKLVDALLDQDREPIDFVKRLVEYEYVGPIHGNPYGGAYKIRRRLTGEIRVLWRISAFFVDPLGLSAEQASTDMVHLFHPNIAAPVELILYRETVYVISEYFDGQTLVDVLKSHRTMPVPVVCEIMSQVARGLSGIHSFFKAHADVRPANVLIGCRGRDRGHIKLSGVAGGIVDEHKARFAVWPAGMRYAPAFYAPEILSGERDPDPRSDVFSLGRLMYSTLVGKPLLPGTDSDERISNTRRDCPPDLEAAILQMMAEDPDERYETATDVLPLIAKYAVPEQLVSWLANEDPDGASATEAGGKESDDVVRFFPISPPDSSKHSTGVLPLSGHESPEITASPIGASAKTTLQSWPPKNSPVKTSGNHAKDGQSSKTHPSPWHRRLLILAGLVLLMGIASVPLRHRLVPTTDTTGPPLWVVSLTELPGPNGDWWFEETPWFTPEVRAELARRVLENDPVLDRDQLQAVSDRLRAHPDFETVNELHEIVRKSMRRMPPELALVTRQIDEIHPEAHSVGELKLEYAGILDELGTSEEDSATRWHLRANLLQASSNSAEATLAYERALELYGQNPSPDTAGLQALCESDYGLLLASFERNYRKANTYYRLAFENAKSTALDVVCLCLLGDSERKWGRRNDSLKTLLTAKRLLEMDSTVLPEHPLHAVVAETRGWASFDTWRLDEASRAFERARDIRSIHSQAGNPRSWRAILWIEQGQAMTAHFRGDQKQAQEKYRKLLDQIDSSLKGGFIRDLPKQQRTELAARRPNLYERLADCYLFGAGIDPMEASRALTLAVQATEDSSFDSERLWPHILALKYKYALSLVLAGDRTLANEAYNHAEKELALRSQQEAEVSDGQKRVFDSIRTVSHALLQLEGNSAEERKAAVDALEAYHASASSQVTRSNIDLIMLVTEELLKPAMLPGDKSARIVRRLNSIIQSLRTAEDNRLTSLYLQRYCESGQRALRSASNSSTAMLEPNLNQPLAAVLAESLQQSAVTHRGLTRGSIQYDEAGKPVSCRLHVLTIGVSAYAHHPELELAFADDDSDALFEAYGQLCSDPSSKVSKGCLFQRGEFRNLKNEEATRSAIIDAIEGISRKASDKDLVIVSLSGHGTVDESGSFYFLPADYRDGSLRSSAIWDEELRDMLTRSKSNSILVLDACHSGAATTTGTRDATTQQLHNALYRFTSARKGLVVLAASLSSQTASENPRYGHGVLTLALLEALQGKYNDAALAESQSLNVAVPFLPRPQDSSGLITLADIQYYIGSRVEGLTGGKQRATMNRLGGDLSMRDIPIRFQSNDAN